jgi:hypothetical protein
MPSREALLLSHADSAMLCRQAKLLQQETLCQQAESWLQVRRH